MAKKKKKDKWKQPSAKFNIWVNNLYKQCFDNAADWGIEAAALILFLNKLTPYNASWRISKNKNTTTSNQRTSTKNNRKSLTTVGRLFVKKQIFLNDLMTDDLINQCGLEPHILTKTKKGKPEYIPDMNYQPKKPNTLLAYHRQKPDEEGSSERALPPGCVRVKVVYLICERNEIPFDPDPATFPHSKVGARSPVPVKCKPADAGKVILTAACYLSETGVEGDFSEVEENNIV